MWRCIAALARGYKEKRTVGLKESLTPLALPNVTLKVREILSAARLLQNMSQSRALNRTINRYSNLE